jgi:Delta14-sterol reductase
MKATGKSRSSRSTGATPAKIANEKSPVLKDASLPHFHFEFGGPWGTLIVTLILPVIVLLLVHWSDCGSVHDAGFILSSIISPSGNGDGSNEQPVSLLKRYLLNPVLCPSCSNEANADLACNVRKSQSIAGPIVLLYAFMAVVGWTLFQVLLERCLPAEIVMGTPITVPAQISNDVATAPLLTRPQQQFRLPYRINGHLAIWVTMMLVQCGWPTLQNIQPEGSSPRLVLQFTSAPLYLLYDYTAELAFVTSILCFLFSCYLYISSFHQIPDSNKSATPKVLAVGGTSGHVIYDFFMGRELNPRPTSFSFMKSFDYKEFCELRPGLIGWVLLNIGCAQKQHQHLGFVSGSMILLNLFQGMYVWDALYQERAILTTMDITTDGFGFMLVFGDLCWVPFTYSLQARYLVYHDPQLSYLSLFLILLLHIIGYMIFRGANGQKDAFRRNPDDPSVAHLSYLSTKRGTKLLTSGWWGMARKINYTGDYMMGVTWCLVCGFRSIVPYYYAIYFAILLIHRSTRDDHMCAAKYGDDWIKYKQAVPYRFIPGFV